MVARRDDVAPGGALYVEWERRRSAAEEAREELNSAYAIWSDAAGWGERDMTHFPETAAALRKLKFNIRASMCELFASWSLRVAPDGYVPSYVEACVDACRRRGAFENLHM